MEDKFDIVKLSELIGVIIGDGNIHYNSKTRKYFFEITGDPKLERDYFEYVRTLISSLLDKNPKIYVRDRGLRIRVYSKEFVEFLINKLNMPYGEGKCEKVEIPELIYSQDWGILKYCIRGITDTDGSLFVSKKPGIEKYPGIEISTTSKNLSLQLRKIISQKYRIGFREFKKDNYRRRYILSINGNIMVDKWIKDIGFSNKRKLKVWERGDLNSRL